MKTILNLFMVALILFAVGAVPFVSAQNDNAPAEPPAGSNEIRMNFRGVPLDTVLDYLSQSAGYIIIKETDFNGRVDAWSYQPLTKDEAYEVLNTILNQKGYAAIRNGKTLTIVNRDDAKMRDIPVKTGNEPSQIPKSDEMINQIIPVRYANAIQLIENLEPLKPSYATMTANESSNAIVYTDTQTNVRRMVEIIRALDTSISSISSVRVFPLRFSDATELAETIEELFTVEEQNNNRGGGRGGFPPFFGRGGRGGGDDDAQQPDSAAMQAVSRIVAVADERSNSLIVSAADELMPLIEKVVSEVDTTIDDITELQVFKLKNADATEMAELITELFADDSNQTQTPQFGGRGGFFGGFGGGRGGNNNNNNNQSERQLQQTAVTCVPDARTNSIVVTAAHETMVQIAQMVERLDENTDKKQNVRVIRLKYADVDNVANILRSIFIDQVSGNSQTTNQNNNQNTLSNRTVEDTGFSTSTNNN